MQTSLSIVLGKVYLALAFVVLRGNELNEKKLNEPLFLTSDFGERFERYL